MFTSSSHTECRPGDCKSLLDASKSRLFNSSTHIVMGGGGIYGVMYIGVLMELCGYDEAVYAAWSSRLVGVAGTSAGTVIGLMVAAGMNPWRMRATVHAAGLSRVMDGMLDLSLTEIRQSSAVTSGKTLDEVVQEFVLRVTGRTDTTFHQFFLKTRRNFVVVVTNAVTSMAEFWNYKTRPELELWKAIRCSSSIPGLFPAPVINGTAFFDGGVTCNLPCHLFPPRATLSLFVHAVFKEMSSVKLLATILQGLVIYMSSAQLGPMRMSPMLAFRAVPCCTCSADTGLLGPYAFDAPLDAMDALMSDGCRSVRSVMQRDVLAAVMLLVHLVLKTAQKCRQGVWPVRPVRLNPLSKKI